MLHTGSRGTPNGSGGGSGLVKGPTGMVGAPGTATVAASHAPLHGARTGGGGPTSTAGLPHAQPTGSARPGAEHSALGGDSRRPTSRSSGPPAGRGGEAWYGRRAAVAPG